MPIYVRYLHFQRCRRSSFHLIMRTYISFVSLQDKTVWYALEVVVGDESQFKVHKIEKVSICYNIG